MEPIGAMHAPTANLHAPAAPRCCCAQAARRRTRRRQAACRAVAAPEREVVDREAQAVPEGLNAWSRHITQPKSQGASQAMLFATGLREEDLGKPQVRSSDKLCCCRGAQDAEPAAA